MNNDSIPDYIPQIINGEKSYLMSARGVLRFIVCEFIEHPLEGKKVIKAAKWIFNKISENGYGLTQMQIFAKVKLMTRQEANMWVNETYGEYISQEEVMDLFKNL